MFKYVLLITLALVLPLTACSAPTAVGPIPVEKIRLPMGYIPNVQFTPFYVAVDRGYFQEQGIEIEFDYRFETDGMKLVAANELPFSIQSGEQVPLAREQGLPVIYVAQWWQHFPVVVVALAESGISSPADLEGKTIGTPLFGGASYIGWKALVSRAGLDESTMRVLEIGYTQLAALTQGTVDAAICYINNEPIQLARAGRAIHIIEVSPFANLVSNGLVTNESTIAQRPELVEAMVTALLHGLRDTIADPDAAFEIAKKYVEGLGTDPETDAAQRQVLAASIELWQADEPGLSSAADWETTLAVLREAGLLKIDMAAEDVFTNYFVEKATE